MNLFEVKKQLTQLETVQFQLPNGNWVPKHFHITEIGKITKNFIDCGGTLRSEELVGFQLWNAGDYDHRLHPQKLLDIIELAEKALGMGNSEIEVEYQAETIGKFGLDFKDTHFLLTTKHANCLAKENCGVPENDKLQATEASCCTPGSGCC